MIAYMHPFVYTPTHASLSHFALLFVESQPHATQIFTFEDMEEDLGQSKEAVEKRWDEGRQKEHVAKVEDEEVQCNETLSTTRHIQLSFTQLPHCQVTGVCLY